jgi:uroporphyrinogen-III synthase
MGEILAAGDAQPLAGLRVVITRAAKQSRELIARLKGAGAAVLFLPAIEFAEPENRAPLDAAIFALGSFDWLLFTSANAVRFFAKRRRELGLDPEALRKSGKSVRVAAVGPATAEEARIDGIAVTVVAAEFRGDALARELSAQINGKRVLLPRSDRAADELPEALRAAGAEVTDVIAYRTVDVSLETVSPEALEAVRSGNADVICFFSPSAFRSIEARVGRVALRRASLAAIGPVTAAAICEAGLEVAIESREATTKSFVDALSERFAAKVSRGVRTT